MKLKFNHRGGDLSGFQEGSILISIMMGRVLDRRTVVRGRKIDFIIVIICQVGAGDFDLIR